MGIWQWHYRESGRFENRRRVNFGGDFQIRGNPMKINQIPMEIKSSHEHLQNSDGNREKSDETHSNSNGNQVKSNENH